MKRDQLKRRQFRPRPVVRPSRRLLLVAAGYAAAFIAAAVAVGVFDLVSPNPDIQNNSSGMAAFSESLLFLAAFGLASLPATAAALYFLHAFRPFWRVASPVAVGIAATAVAAMAGCLFPGNADPNSLPGFWVTLSPLRILLAPLCGMAFLLASLLAPERAHRSAFIASAAMEMAAFGGVGLSWLGAYR